MDSDIRLCGRKYEGEITEEETNRIDFLSKQYSKNINRAKANNKIIGFKKKIFPPIILIMFLFTLGAIVTFVATTIKSLMLQWIIGLPSVIFNGYTYLVFYINYLFQEKEEEQIISKNIEEITDEINRILKKYHIDVEDFYKELDSNTK